MTFKPLLAYTIKDLTKLKFPVYASPKVDGIRGTVVDGTLRTRSGKLFPNRHVRESLAGS